jgi:hypothetical protein
MKILLAFIFVLSTFSITSASNYEAIPANSTVEYTSQNPVPAPPSCAMEYTIEIVIDGGDRVRYSGYGVAADCATAYARAKAAAEYKVIQHFTVPK